MCFVRTKKNPIKTLIYSNFRRMPLDKTFQPVIMAPGSVLELHASVFNPAGVEPILSTSRVTPATASSPINGSRLEEGGSHQVFSSSGQACPQSFRLLLC